MARILFASNTSQLQTALQGAQAGDTIKLAPGNYGDVVISNRVFSADISITSMDSHQPATFNSIRMQYCANIAFSDIAVNLVPTATSIYWDRAIGINACSGISISNSTITGGNAINGVEPTATALDATQNVRGLPTGLGIQVTSSTDISIAGNTLTKLGKGIGLSNSSGISIVNNDISELRQTHIAGVAVSNLTIEGNHLTNARPWAWDKPYGDHGNFIKIWTDWARQSAPSSDINIVGNVIDQGAGTAMLGIYMGSSAIRTAPGFTNVSIENNAIINGHHLGLALEKFNNSTILNNTLIASPGAKAVPGLYFGAAGGGNNVVSGNILGSVKNVSATADETNTYTGNQLAQSVNSSGLNYFDPDVLALISASDTPAEIAALIRGALPSSSASSVYSGTAANIAANINTLAANAAITKIVATDGEPIKLSVSAWLSNGAALDKVVDRDGKLVPVKIIDKSAAIIANITALAADPAIATITATDVTWLRLTADQALNSRPALEKMTTAAGARMEIVVGDTAANLSGKLDDLADIANLKTILVSDAGVVAVSAAEYVSEQAVFAKISGTYSLKIVDTADNISARMQEIADLQTSSNARVSSMVVTDNRPVTIGAADLYADRALIAKLINADGEPGKVAIVDTAANLAENAHSISTSKVVASVVVENPDGSSSPVPMSALTNQTVKGTAGHFGEILQGGFGSDYVYGHGDSNQLIGGGGRDFLIGGRGTDFFVFNQASDSTVRNSDVIRNFQTGIDKIDLRGLEKHEGPDFELTFVGSAAFKGLEGAVQTVATSTSTLVQVDINGDRLADMQIEVAGVRSLSSSDFLL